MSEPKEDGKLYHQSGVNLKGEPFVQLIMDGKVLCQMTPKEARDHAGAIVGAAEASEQDAFILDWAQKVLELTFGQAGAFMQDYRKWREKNGGRKGGPSDPNDFVIPEGFKR